MTGLSMIPCQFTSHGRRFLDLFFVAEEGLLRLRADALWDLVARWTGTGAGFTTATSSESGPSSSEERDREFAKTVRLVV